MNEPPAPTVLPDEDEYVFPRAWSRRARPRRGDGIDRKVGLAPREARSFIKAKLSWLREMLALPENEAYSWDGNDFLDGNPNPLGAAAVAALIGITRRTTHVPADSMFHLLVKVHGLPLAASAAVETMGLHVDFGGNHGERRIIHPLNDFDIGYEWTHVVAEVVKDLRALVAAAPESEYAETVAALALHRDTLPKALTASLITPDLTSWVDQLCQLLARHEPDHYISMLLLQTITSPAQLEAAGGAASGSVDGDIATADLLARLGTAALPIFKQHIERSPTATRCKPMYEALAAMPTDEAMAVLIDHLDAPGAVRPAMAAAARFPVRALHHIAPRIAGADRERRKLLATVLRSDPVLLDTALPGMDPNLRDAIEPLLGESRRLPAARPEELPKLLVEPPWSASEPKPKTGTVDGLAPLPIERIVWADGERERLLPTDHFEYRTPEQWCCEAENFDRSSWSLFFLAHAPDALAAPLAPKWDGKESSPSKHEMQRVLARFGLDVAPQIAALTETEPDLRSVLLPLVNLQAARIAADSLTRRKTAMADAIAWFSRHDADAAVLLIPDALGKDRKRRRNAHTALDFIRAIRGPEPLLAAAAAYGEAAVAAIRPLAERDPLAPLGEPVPAAWAVPAALPELLLRGRERSLPDAAVRRVIEVMSVTGFGWRYAGIDVVAATCDPESLARFSWAVFEHWEASGSPIRDTWAFTQLAHFGDDDTVRALVPLISDWPSRNLHKRAATGIEVLGAIGTLTALRAIHRISEKVGHWSLEQTASAQIDAIAARQGLSTDQLADRLVPDFGIGEETALVYDYGPRRFKVGFDEELRPRITDMDGKPRKALPAPGARDDTELAASARKRFARLKKDVRTVASDLVKRLERDMVQQRPRTKTEFDRYVVEHALVRQLSHRLIWTADRESGPTAFRLAEDGTCTDVHEEKLTLPEDAAIRPAHPVLLGDTVTAWTAILADYEILQPFKQIHRPTFAFTDEELRTGRLTRFEDVEVSTGHVLGLAHRGWTLEDPGMTAWIPNVGYVVVRLGPAIDEAGTSRSRTVLDARVNQSGRFDLLDADAPIRLRHADLIPVSEALAEFARITRNT